MISLRYHRLMLEWCFNPSLIYLILEEVILAEERTTQEERNHIMEARKRAATKRRKLKSIGKSKSTETDEDDEDAADEGEKDYFLSQNQSVPQDFKF